MPDIITGTFLVNDIYARFLFDSGANQSFIDHRFCRLLNKTLAKLNNKYVVETANGDLVQTSEILNDCNITLSEYVILVQLLPMTLAGFDIVLGMEWLASNQARILCDKKTIELRSPKGNILTINGDKLSNSVGIISMLKATKYLRKGRLAYLVSITADTKKKIEDVPVIVEFLDVFPDELPGIPPDREVEFRINLVPGTAPISKAPYRLAPTEMVELKKQLDELLEKGFIRPSSSPWGASVLFVKKKDGKANVVADALSRKEHEKPKRVRALRLYLHIDLITRIKESQKLALQESNLEKEGLGGMIDQLVKGDDGILRMNKKI
ncbi:hypothetical protein L1987_13244 [Smallanthus sonchifolius]|uniref:Uncharacterized protein n=1 Tax=Smallanthus sonchifolius TaxID=185202 RepID=A0ACB9JIP1_9ASTR|nr:hypothetical protein L1987_13244 [Smallanthus sonchifolius]